MSIESYKQNVAKRVTGPTYPTCFPAALEQVSHYSGYDPSVYRYYRDFINWYFSFPTRDWDSLIFDAEEMLDELVRPLGGLACDDLVLKRANTPIGFSRIVKPLLREDFRVTVDISYPRNSIRSLHSVGVLPVNRGGDYVTLVSTHVPKSLQGVIPLSKVAEHVAVYPETHMQAHPFNDANIVALPPEY